MNFCDVGVEVKQHSFRDAPKASRVNESDMRSRIVREHL